MKRQFISLLALLLTAQFIWAKDVTAPADIPAYYANANGKSGTSLYNALNTITNVGFSSLGYDGAITAYQTTDVYPTDPSHPDYEAGKAGKLWDMYGACSFTLGDECGNYSDECDCYNREHSIPKSWWGGGKNNMYSDIFHLVPTDGYVNNRRSAYAFGEVESVSYTYNGCKLGSSKSSISTDKETLLGTSATCSGTVFEPKEEYKGDFARGYLGMIAKYSNESYSITSGNGGLIFEAFKSTTHLGLTKYGIVLLMKWHREDPVSRKEIDRNNGIQKTQGNRNPFIDYPYLAEYIWGEKHGQTVDLSKLMPSSDPNFVPGVSNGWRGDDTPPTPPTPTVKYGVTWSVNGEELRVDSIEENQSVTELPETPTSCSTESNQFMGWTNAPIQGTSSDAPAVLYTAANEIPTITKNITLYAVFAKKEQVGGGSSVSSNEMIVFADKGLANDKAVTSVTQGDVVLTFDKGTNGSGNAPKYYDTGKAIRCYAGNTMTVTAPSMTEINLTYGTGDKSNPITTNVGTFDTNKWTGSANEVVFTIGGTKDHRRIATVNVKMSGSGTITVYDRYITSCQTATEVEIEAEQITARKVLVGGQIYILIGEQMFNLQGQRIK